MKEFAWQEMVWSAYLMLIVSYRRIFARLNAQCLISGAFGVFRKSTLLGINGYDIDTVGEDMELVLRLQEQDFQKSKKRIVYEATAVCYMLYRSAT